MTIENTQSQPIDDTIKELKRLLQKHKDTEKVRYKIMTSDDDFNTVAYFEAGDIKDQQAERLVQEIEDKVNGCGTCQYFDSNSRGGCTLYKCLKYQPGCGECPLIYDKEICLRNIFHASCEWWQSLKSKILEGEI